MRLGTTTTTTRRILSVVSSVCDPLGFAAPFTLPAKALLQDLCCKNLGWDDPISDEDLTCWRNWLDELPRLKDLKVNCCFKPINFGEVTSRQLHHFADASQHAYGTVTYLCLTNSKDDVHCSFIIGKSRLSPLKQLTIPCLELSAAIVAMQLDGMVMKEIGIPVNQSIFWTDSTCVLGYITNEDKRFHTFVANCVATTKSPHLLSGNTLALNRTQPTIPCVASQLKLCCRTNVGCEDQISFGNQKMHGQTNSIRYQRLQRITQRSRENHKCFLPTLKQG